MRRARVYNFGQLAGCLEEHAEGYRFTYDTDYLMDTDAPPVSLTLPKRSEPYTSPTIFPFFFGLLAEGVTKRIQCRQLKLDEHDHFGRLVKTAHSDVVGSVTIEEADES